MKAALLALGAAGVGVAVLLATLKLIFVAIQRKLSIEVQRKFGGKKILRQASNANTFGQKSKGFAQIRGNGASILTENALWFLLAVPRRELEIPLCSIASVSLPRSHLGKTRFRPPLCVDYQSEQGPDAVAWAVRDPEDWKAAIDAARAEA